MSKAIIVTGASKGIGLAISRYLISQSHNVVVVARSGDLLAQLQNEHKAQVRVLAGDLSDLSLPQKAVDLCLTEFGRLDALVINHGIMEPVARIVDSKPEEWSRLFTVNLFSAVAFTKAAIPELRKHNGIVLLTSSGASTGAYNGWGAYAASKAAINQLAKQIACEEPEITSIALRPGVVDTDMQRDVRDKHSLIMTDKEKEKFAGMHTRGELLRPEQPGHVLAKMALDPPRELSGQYLNWQAPELAKFQ